MTSKGNFFVLHLKLDESEIGEWMANFFVQGWAMHLRNTMLVVVGRHWCRQKMQPQFTGHQSLSSL